MAVQNLNEMLKQLPSVGELLEGDAGKDLLNEYPRRIVLGAIKNILDELRSGIKRGEPTYWWNEEERIHILEKNWRSMCVRMCRSSLKRVINATGIIVHTNLGRSPLSKSALNRILETTRGYSNLEYDLIEGERSKRHLHVEGLLHELTGAEAVHIVNNNAGAVLLALNTMARYKEVIVSRGELVEIGGSFRIPDVMAQSGAILVEAGTTNRTHLKDYEDAITEDTGLLLKAHQSNFFISGFTAQVTGEELVGLGRKKGIPVMLDLGSGSLIRMDEAKGEPYIHGVIDVGVDIVTFSGDKFLGGPQAGIILGKKEYIERMQNNPLARALRVDKLCLAALEATLREYLDGERAVENIPVLKAVNVNVEELGKKGEELVQSLTCIKGENIGVLMMDGYSFVGGGAAPGDAIETKVLCIEVEGRSADEIAGLFRSLSVPVIGRIEKDRYLWDLRTVLSDEKDLLIMMFKEFMELLDL